MHKPKSRLVTFYCPVSLHAAVVEHAHREGETASSLIRRAMRDILAGKTPNSEVAP